MIRPRRMRWTGYMAHIGEECIQGFGRKSGKKKQLEVLDTDGTIIIKWNVDGWDGDVDWIRFAQDRTQ
jgi:hypothetical protein